MDEKTKRELLQQVQQANDDARAKTEQANAQISAAATARREAFQSALDAGLSRAEIADHLGISRQALHQTLRR